MRRGITTLAPLIPAREPVSFRETLRSGSSVAEKTPSRHLGEKRRPAPLTLSRCKPFSHHPLTALRFSVMVKVTYAHPPKALR